MHKEPENPKDPYGEKETYEMFEVNGKMCRFKKVWSGKGKMMAEKKKKMYKAQGLLVRSEQEARGHWNVYTHKPVK
jgi:hypothetical protein